MLEDVDASAKLGWGDSPDNMDVDGFGSEEIGSPEPAGFAVERACGCEDEELVAGAIWVSKDGPGGLAG